MNVLKLCIGPLQTNCYIVYGKDKKAAVIDPAFSAEKINRVIVENGLVLDKILLTHAHFDHIMGVEDLHKNGVELYLHSGDEDMFHDPNLNYMSKFFGRDIEFEKAEHLLRDGDLIDIGGEQIRVMHTPGHTKGSVCYISDEYIFSGDTLFKEGVGRCDLYGGNYIEITESIKKLSELEGDRKVYPGHGESSTLNHEKNYNTYMKL